MVKSKSSATSTPKAAADLLFAKHMSASASRFKQTKPNSLDCGKKLTASKTSTIIRRCRATMAPMGAFNNQ